jgi:hypothetical protein
MSSKHYIRWSHVTLPNACSKKRAQLANIVPKIDYVFVITMNVCPCAIKSSLPLPVPCEPVLVQSALQGPGHTSNKIGMRCTLVSCLSPECFGKVALRNVTLTNSDSFIAERCSHMCTNSGESAPAIDGEGISVRAMETTAPDNGKYHKMGGCLSLAAMCVAFCFSRFCKSHENFNRAL